MSTDHCIARRQQSGFTLVELLVVISIITLLVAMLLPVLANARQSGQNAQCMSNLRQIGIAISGYGTDNRGHLPGSDWTVTSFDPNATSGATTGWTPDRWPLALKYYFGADHLTTVAEVNTKVGAMQCPATFFLNANMSYGLNRYAAGKATTSEWRYNRSTPRTLDDRLMVKYSSNFMIGGESTFNNQMSSDPSGFGAASGGYKTLHAGLWGAVKVASRLHMDIRNFLLADMHVESQPPNGKRFVINEAATSVTTPQGKGKIQWGRDDTDADMILNP